MSTAGSDTTWRALALKLQQDAPLKKKAEKRARSDALDAIIERLKEAAVEPHEADKAVTLRALLTEAQLPFFDQLIAEAKKRHTAAAEEPKAEVARVWNPKEIFTPEEVAEIEDEAEAQLAATKSEEAPDDSPEEEETMAKPIREARAPQQEEQYEDEVEEGGEEQFEEYEEEPAPRQRRAAQVPRMQPIVVQVPQQRVAPARRGHSRVSSPNRPLLARTEKLRVYKRSTDGRRAYLADYATDEIGGMSMKRFLKEFVDPEYGDPSGRTQYEVCEVDPRTDEDRGPTSSVIIESMPQQTNDEFDRVRNAAALLQELRETTQPEVPEDGMLTAMKQKAAQEGNFNSMMMLMMMERLMQPRGGNSEEILLKILDRLDKRDGGGSPPRDSFGPPTTFGPGPGFGAMPPWMPPPPPPPREHGALDKVVEVAIAKLAEPPRSIADQLKDFTALQQLTGGGNAIDGLRAEIRQLAQAQAAPKSGLEDAVASFEKMKTIVTTLAPELGAGGGIGNVLKNLVTPELGKALGGVLAEGIQQETAKKKEAQGNAPPPPGTQTVTAQQVAQPAQPPPVPEGVKAAINGLKVAQTREVQVQRTVDVLQAMFLSQDPRYLTMLEPALAALQKEDPNPGRRVISLLLQGTRPELFTAEFVDAVITALIKRADAQVPAAFAATAGQWVLDFNGNVVPLSRTMAAEVKEEPKPEPKAEAQPEPKAEPAVEVVTFKAPDKAPEPAQALPVEEPPVAPRAAV